MHDFAEHVIRPAAHEWDERSLAFYDEATDEWILNGAKTFITRGGIADVHVLVLSVDPALGASGQASFVVPPGDARSGDWPEVQKMGIRASHTAEVILDDCRVPGRCLLGAQESLDECVAGAREGGSSRGQPAMAVFDASRPAVGAQAVRIARAALEYAKEPHSSAAQSSRTRPSPSRWLT